MHYITRMLLLIRTSVIVGMLCVTPLLSRAEEQGVLPYADAVRGILAPLQYSELGGLLDSKSKVTIDFEKNIWILQNIFEFDEYGIDILSEGNSGVCGRLSRYVYHKIKDVFPDTRYKIMFEKVKERDFFFAPQAIHFVITIEDNENSQKYLLDPSFKRYGRMEDFDQYAFIEQQEPKTFIESNKSLDKFFRIGSASPILIRDDYLLLFSVESVDGLVDKNHFILSVSAVKRQEQKAEYVLGLKYVDGYLQTYSHEKLMRQLLNPEEVRRLQQRMLQWSVYISGN